MRLVQRRHVRGDLATSACLFRRPPRFGSMTRGAVGGDGGGIYRIRHSRQWGRASRGRGAVARGSAALNATVGAPLDVAASAVPWRRGPLCPRVPSACACARMHGCSDGASRRRSMGASARSGAPLASQRSVQGASYQCPASFVHWVAAQPRPSPATRGTPNCHPVITQAASPVQKEKPEKARCIRGRPAVARRRL